MRFLFLSQDQKSNVALNAWLPQSSYPCGNFSDTSCLKPLKSKGSIGPAFAVCIHTENQNQASFCPFALREVSVPTELALGHLRYAINFGQGSQFWARVSIFGKGLNFEKGPTERTHSLKNKFKLAGEKLIFQ